jgi:type VI secretion system protein VasD
MNIRALLSLLAAGSLAASLAGCGSAPVVEPPPPPLTVDVALAATADVNPDINQRASPLVVRVYELADAEAFNGADFFALWNQEPVALAAALVKRHEFVLAPEGKADKVLTLDPRVQAIGVVAAFRDIRNANWRAVVPVSQDPKGARAFRLDIAASGKNAVATLKPVTAPAAGTSP